MLKGYEKMTDALQNLHPILQAILVTCFTWGLTALGAGVVFIIMRMKVFGKKKQHTNNR